ncbi:MAG: helix-turn-helix transcriptional regulator [Clostridia bacterium]|nr:helix-turn-helix transcriptional regulator [Clostridia bacterium]
MKNLDYGLLLSGTWLRDHNVSEHLYPGQKTYETTMFASHCHPHYEVLYVYENERMITFERQKFVLNKNKICIIPPYTMHKVQPTNDMPQKRILMAFTKEYIEKYAEVFDINPLSSFSTATTVLDLSEEDALKVKTMLDEVMELTGNDSYSNQMFALTALKLLTFCTEKLSPAAESKKFNIIDKIIKYIEVHYHADLTLDLLAAEFAVSKYEISRNFSKVTGMTFLQYLTRIRIENAKRLLKNHKLTITNVGTHTGFRSSSDFARVFRSVTGMTPSQYRKLNQQQKSQYAAEK